MSSLRLSNVKFEVVKQLAEGSYLSWIAPDRKSKKKGATRIPVRVIEYVIEENGTELVSLSPDYRFN